MKLLNIREVYKIFLRYQRSHIFLRGCKREVGYAHKIAEMLGRFMSALRWLPLLLSYQVLSLGWEDPLEEEMAPHSSILVWKIPWTEEPDRLQSMGSLRVRYD